jgi:hypothetical protein
VADRDGNARQVDQDDDDHGVRHFSWGRTNEEVMLLARYQGDSGPVVAIDVLDLRTSERTPFITDELLAASSAGVSIAQCRGLTTSPDGTRLALLFADPDASLTRILEYDYATQLIREVQTIEDDHIGAHLAWGPDGNGLAISLSKTSHDIYMWEPRPDADVAAADQGRGL